MIEELVKRMRSLDLLTTEIDADDWCIEADKALQEAAAIIERLHGSLQLINAQVTSALKRDHN